MNRFQDGYFVFFVTSLPRNKITPFHKTTERLRTRYLDNKITSDKYKESLLKKQKQYEDRVHIHEAYRKCLMSLESAHRMLILHKNASDTARELVGILEEALEKMRKNKSSSRFTRNEMGMFRRVVDRFKETNIL